MAITIFSKLAHFKILWKQIFKDGRLVITYKNAIKYFLNTQLELQGCEKIHEKSKITLQM